MTTHTPGPWVWIKGSDAINRRWDNRDWTVASVGNHRLGWHKDKNCESREAGANARLIAAAPELLEALKDSYPYIDNDHLRHRIGAVIAKATGAKT